jgi:hypothetical protein
MLSSSSSNILRKVMPMIEVICVGSKLEPPNKCKAPNGIFIYKKCPPNCEISDASDKDARQYVAYCPYCNRPNTIYLKCTGTVVTDEKIEIGYYRQAEISKRVKIGKIDPVENVLGGIKGGKF